MQNNTSKMSVTALRRNLYKVVDQVLETGIPVEIERQGRTVLITAVEPVRTKLSRLVRRDTIAGDPADLVTLKVSEWREPDDLD